jgi:predicted  nucleic acid-binding Zn-ribbon protein
MLSDHELTDIRIKASVADVYGGGNETISKLLDHLDGIEDDMREEIRDDFADEIGELEAEVQTLKDANAGLREQRNQLRDRNLSLTKECAELRAKLERFEAAE